MVRARTAHLQLLSQNGLAPPVLKFVDYLIWCEMMCSLPRTAASSRLPTALSRAVKTISLLPNRLHSFLLHLGVSTYRTSLQRSGLGCRNSDLGDLLDSFSCASSSLALTALIKASITPGFPAKSNTLSRQLLPIRSIWILHGRLVEIQFAEAKVVGRLELSRLDDL